MKVSCPLAFLIKLKRKVKKIFILMQGIGMKKNICMCILQFQCYKDQHKLK